MTNRRKKKPQRHLRKEIRYLLITLAAAICLCAVWAVFLKPRKTAKQEPVKENQTAQLNEKELPIKTPEPELRARGLQYNRDVTPERRSSSRRVWKN
ncbi:MAG: hypothetical protein IKG55_05520 [Solobacterium sp.]|nr:hypothetical protein [Solobacterium sp.]